MSGSQRERVDLDIVIPVFNEIEVVEQLHWRVLAACRQIGCPVRILYVDDGSQDATADWIRVNAIDRRAPTWVKKYNGENVPLGRSDRTVNQPNVTLIQLSRNFGQPAAILAGLQHSTASCVAVMDGDLQDPPEIIPEMFARWQAGNQVVIAQRTGRQETLLRGLAFKAFHAWFRYLSDSSIPANTGTFCLLDKDAAKSICELRESHRFFPGLRAWIGYQQTMVTYRRPQRAGGAPKQNFFRLFKYALDAVFGFSYKPLRLLTWSGVATCGLAFALSLWFIFKRIVGWETATTGFTTLTCSILGFCGFQLIGMGILGEYLGRIYDEVKQRPQFIVSNQVHSDSAPVNSLETTAFVERRKAG